MNTSVNELSFQNEIPKRRNFYQNFCFVAVMMSVKMFILTLTDLFILCCYKLNLKGS